MPDDERTRRRLGDATKGRIADLASGWSVDEPESAAPDPEPPAPAATRQKHKTMPPPAPGSAARKELEDAILDSNTPIPIATPRTKPPSRPPRSTTSTGRADSSSLLMKSGPTETGTVMRSGIIGGTPPPEKTNIPRPSIPIADHSGSIVDSMPVSAKAPASSGPIGTKSGPTNAIPVGTKSGPTNAIPAGTKSGPVTAIPAGTKSGPTSALTNGSDAKLGTKSGSVPAIADPSKRPPPPPPRRGKTAPPPIPVAARSGAIERLPLRADPTDPAPQAPAPPPPRAAARPQLLDSEELQTLVEDEPGAMPKLAVPLGEFDTGAGTTLDQDKLRIAYEQATMKRDAASALLGLAEPSETVVKAPPVGVLLEETAQLLLRGDPTNIDSSTTRFERGDPTLAPDSTASSVPVASGGTLRPGASLRRKRGVAGDLRYVATVLLGVRNARAELTTLEARSELGKTERKRHLVTLGRAAASLDHFDHPALGPARERLAAIEDERSRYAGAVAAADSELARVKRDREAKAKQVIVDIAALEAELVEITKKLEPLEKESIAIDKRATDLRDSLRHLDAQIKATEASQHSAKARNTELANIQAEIATLKADRIAVRRDEPAIAAEKDALAPRIAALESRRSEARKKRTDLELNEKKDQARTDELLAAIGAKRKVVDRATSDAEALRDKVLFDLGERLYVDRPPDVTAELSPIDDIDVDLGTGGRRMMELREIISSVDRAKLYRGIAYASGLVLLLGAIVAGILYLAL